ncbi:MAG: hypothetical protein WA213_04545 [Terriglobales bacterium]
MFRWTARVALLVMLVPSLGPLVQAAIAPERMQCCVRRPLTGTRAAAGPAMQCHHGASLGVPEAGGARTESPQATFQPLDCCGQRCDCCRNSKISEWASIASRHLSFVNLLIEPAAGASSAARVSAPLIDADSARAPPRS